MDSKFFKVGHKTMPQGKAVRGLLRFNVSYFLCEYRNRGSARMEEEVDVAPIDAHNAKD